MTTTTLTEQLESRAVHSAGPIRHWPAWRVHEAFERLVDRQPDAPAMVSDAGAVTYASLDARANALAHALLERGVTPEEPVGVFVARSASLPAAFLAILKAGGAYVPMGADLPAGRLADMAAQCGMRSLIALDGLEPPAELAATLTVFRPETAGSWQRRPNLAGGLSDLAAILFTSGSTGRPKGVLLEHRACVNMALGHIDAHGIAPTDRVLLATAPGFILGFRELCLPMLAGAAFVPATRALVDDPAALLAQMSRHRVSVAMFTPSYLRLFEGAVPDGLRCLLTAGERPNPSDARAYARRLDYWNIHGATEVCGTICMTRVDPNGAGPLASGRPFTNMAVHLLDRDGNPAAAGEAGEIYVTGVSLARGYLGQPELTADRFVDTGFGRAYRSCDMGRWNPEGQIESLGRADDMVKVSGQAVSLREIEHALLRRDGVRQAAAIEHNGKLIAFVEANGASGDSLAEWHRFLGRTLASYMLPAQVAAVHAIPVNAYGKVDRQALVALAGHDAAAHDVAGEPPQGQVECSVARVWEEVLGAGRVMRQDNFFSLGGTSLLAIAIGQRLQALGYAVTAQAVLGAGTVAALARRIADRPLEAASNAAVEDALEGPATAGQQDFWVAWKLGLDNSGSQITRVLAVTGREAPPEPERWRSAWLTLIARHAALRTAFAAGPGDTVLWRTRDSAPATFTLDYGESALDARRVINARANAPFLLTEAPLARAGLVHVSTEGKPEETLFWFTLHHAMVDGFSARILQDEMFALLTSGELPAAAPNGVAQACQAEARHLASPQAERDRAWWQDHLDALVTTSGGEALHAFTTDYRRPPAPSRTPAPPIVERLDTATVAALTRLAQSQKAGLHALLLALLAAEVRRREGRSNVIVGSALSARPPGADSSLGYFVNLLPLVLAGSNGPSAADQIRAAQAALMETVDHAAYPSGWLYREFRRRHPHGRPNSQNALFDISLTSNPSRNSGEPGAALRFTPRRLPGEAVHAAAGIDLAFSHEPLDEGGLELVLVWNPDVYSQDTATAWLASFASWARWLAQDAARADLPLPALRPAELRRLEQWEHGPVRPRPARRFHELFEAQADLEPTRAAVVAEAGTETYGELERHANRIAHALLERGVTREQPVAVLTECCRDLPATVLGIWKAGAAYLPLALDQPPERLAYLAQDSGARTLIVLDGHDAPEALAGTVHSILRPADWQRCAAVRPAVAGAPRDLAYIIYTSGTTGKPKGVLIQHDSLVNAACISGEVFGLSAEDRFSLVATPGFDASLWELGAALLHGMALVPISRSLRDDPWALKQWYRTHGVTVAFHAPSYLRISKETPFEGLRVLITGGEAPNHDDVRHHAAHAAFFNAYGPTETCIFVGAERQPLHPDPDAPLPIGTPLANLGFSIRRDNGDRVPPGVVGELWLSGAGLARGYLNNPELTARRFVDTPEGRFYRTGDLGRWTEDGRLVLAGRTDDQIKLHGQRIELGEVEQALAAHPAVAQAVALVDKSAAGTRTLRAFVRLRAGAAMPAEEAWRTYLGQHLPVHMIPASVNAIPAVPLNASGKADREALLLASRNPGASGGAPKSPPRGEMETRIAAVWAELLGVAVSHEDSFFGLGGNSLLAVTMAHRLSREFSHSIAARELFAAPTLAGFARRMTELLHATPSPAAPARRRLSSDLATEGQREFRVAEAAGLDTRTFNMPLIRRVTGAEMPPLERWQSAWAALVQRHAALRTCFREDAEGRLRALVAPAAGAELEFSTEADRAAAFQLIRRRQGQTFTMSQPPLWRAGLVQVRDTGEHLFWMAMHHSVGDGQSLGILLRELGALVDGQELAPLPAEFAETAAREEAYLASPDYDQDAHYWRDLLDGQPGGAFAEVPPDFPRSSGTAPVGMHRFEKLLDAATGEGLLTLARQHGASLHAVMLTLVAIEARRRTGRADVMIGTAASVRETAAEQQVAGYYINMLPVPCHAPAGATFAAALLETQQTLARGLEHSRYPFAHLYHDFWTRHPEHHHPGRFPIFDLAVTENPGVPESRRFAAVSDSALPAEPGTMSYRRSDTPPGEDMVLLHDNQVHHGGLTLLWQANTALYTRQTGAAWFQGICDWAEWLGADPQRASEVLPALTPRETALAARWESGESKPRPRVRFHELFERSLDSTTGRCDRPAVIAASRTIAYGELEREANSIAHALLAGGVNSGSVIGVVTGRSVNLPATVLGIWKAGATYLPLAADLPAERLVFMARDAGVARLMALDGLDVPEALAAGLPPVFRPESLDAAFRSAHSHRPEQNADASEIAYIVYTSGSTGRPKGTLIPHDAYVNTVLGAGETLGITPDDRCLMFASPSFDVSLSDLGLPLAFGAAVCPVPYEVLSSPAAFRSFLAGQRVTVADITPTYLRLFDGADLASVRILVTGGEPPFAADVAAYAGRVAYFNAYGPTENTITSTMCRLAPGDGAMGAAFPAGRPLPNTSVHIVDAAGSPVPPGMPGEIWLAGAGLARGYVARPEQTAAAFVETPSGRRYRTGDQGRWNDAGALEVLGRLDDQVKLNGIRIELGEIEHALTAHPAIAQAVALLDGDDGGAAAHSLRAFVRVQPGCEAPSDAAWRDYLAGRLPAYMIPSTVTQVPAIPLSSSGKVDKAALKALRPPPAGDGAPPAEGLESDIARLWTELLGVGSAIHRDDNFFTLGGHSLLAIAAAHRLEQTLGLQVPARELFAAPTLRGFAERVGRLRAARKVPAGSPSDRATEGQREFWTAEQAGLDTRGFIIPLTHVVRGADIPPAVEWRCAWARLVERHQALRTSFYQDAEGVLRRRVLTALTGDLEVSTQPDLPSARAYVRDRQAQPFAMDSPPLWRAGLVQVGTNCTNEAIFWLSLHHSVGDGISLGILMRELATLLSGGTLSSAGAGSFDSSAGREETYLAGPASRDDAQFWRDTLSRLPQPAEEWPLDFPRPLGRTATHARGAHHFRIRLDAATGAGLRDFARRHGATLHALMLAILAREVLRRTARKEFLLGTAASTRDSAAEAEVVGYYVNMLPVACRVDRRESPEQTLAAMQHHLAQALEHSRYPFARIYRDFRQDHPAPAALHPARYPLFDLAVTENPAATSSAGSPNAPGSGSTQNSSEQRPAVSGGDGSQAALYELRANAPGQDMVLVHESQHDGSIVLQWLVNAAIYGKDTAEAWIEALAGSARHIASGACAAGSSWPVLLHGEQDRLSQWERGPALEHGAPDFPALFEQWARIQPDRPAVITADGTTSYAQIDVRSNTLAHALLAGGVAPREPVGVLTDRSTALPQTVLGIWKAGACYVPLARELPTERLAFLARDAGIRVLIVLDGLEPPEALAEIACRVVRPGACALASQPVGYRPDGADPAYVIYTSGSTGTPKGVVLNHRGLLNLGVALAAALELQAGDRALLMASPAFDAWISDLAMAWAAGAAVVPVIRAEMDDIAAMRHLMARRQVSVATMPPSYLRLFEQADIPGVRVLMTVGEPPHIPDARHYALRLRYVNGYGPTENTAAATVGIVDPAVPRLNSGKPLANTSVHILDEEGEPVPPGAAGSIWLGGMGLATGYLNRPELTAAAFVEMPGAGRLYRTGDLGRWTSVGDLEILGRWDGQVKVRGQRVELGEIEHRLAGWPGVRQAAAAVDAGADGAQTLWAFVHLADGANEPDPAAWHEYLAGVLPSYMLPAAVLRVPAIPCNTAGKVDRAELLRETAARRMRGGDGASNGNPPREGAERQIAAVWAEHLGAVAAISREDNFFDLGGDSLRAIAVIHQLRRSFHCRIHDLYEHPRLEEFAATCRHRPERLQTLIRSAARDWQDYQRASYEAEREAALASAWRDYRARWEGDSGVALERRRDYSRVLLTGATGYLGSYVLRELLLAAEPGRGVVALVRGASEDHRAARERLGDVLFHYFGPEEGATLRNHPCLTVLAGDLRRDDLGLSPHAFAGLADGLSAVFHCAANVRHFGHYREFHADNVAATGRLLDLAARNTARPADFHFVSTLSVGSLAPEEGFRLFTEYDGAPDTFDENYYIRTKQEGERLVVAARDRLANASIHRVGNLVFAARGSNGHGVPLQRDIRDNAFFRQLGAFIRLGAAPVDSHVWLCHIDVTARALVLLAGAADLANQTLHLEHSRRDAVAGLLAPLDGVRACTFGEFLERLEAAVEQPEMEGSVAETMENFRLYGGRCPQVRARRTEIVSGRTNAMLGRSGFAWPALPAAGQRRIIEEASRVSAGPVALVGAL